MTAPASEASTETAVVRGSTHRASRRKWLAVLLGGTGAAACISLFDTETSEWLAGTFALTLAAFLVSLYAVRRMPNDAKKAWVPFLAYQLLTILGDVVYNIQFYTLKQEYSFGLSDVLYYLSYASALYGLIYLVKKLRFDHADESWLDSVIVSLVGIGLIFAFVFPHALANSVLSTSDTLLALSYPVIDIVILAVISRILFAARRPNMAVVLIAVSFLIYTIADTIYNSPLVHASTPAPGHFMEFLYTVAAVVLATATVAPGAGYITIPPPTTGKVTQSRRVTWLTVAILIVPLAIAFQLIYNPVDANVRSLAATAVIIVAIVLWRVRGLLQTVQDQSNLIAMQARTDALTGLPNRRTLDHALERLNTYPDTPVIVAMLDLDFFKKFNDEYGHQHADKLLTAAGKAWTRILGPDHLLSRYGGEEFTVVMTDVSLADARVLLERCRVSTPEFQTVSVGYAQRLRGEDILHTLRRADRAMYVAKAAGRNRVIAATEEPAEITH